MYFFIVIQMSDNPQWNIIVSRIREIRQCDESAMEYHSVTYT